MEESDEEEEKEGEGKEENKDVTPGGKEGPPMPPPPLPPQPGEVQIRKDYDPKGRVCPVCINDKETVFVKTMWKGF